MLPTTKKLLIDKQSTVPADPNSKGLSATVYAAPHQVDVRDVLETFTESEMLTQQQHLEEELQEQEELPDEQQELQEQEQAEELVSNATPPRF